MFVNYFLRASFPSESLWSVKQHQTMHISKQWEEHFINVGGWQSVKRDSIHLCFVLVEKTTSLLSKLPIKVHYWSSFIKKTTPLSISLWLVCISYMKKISKPFAWCIRTEHTAYKLSLLMKTCKHCHLKNTFCCSAIVVCIQAAGIQLYVYVCELVVSLIRSEFGLTVSVVSSRQDVRFTFTSVLQVKLLSLLLFFFFSLSLICVFSVMF